MKNTNPNLIKNAVCAFLFLCFAVPVMACLPSDNSCDYYSCLESELQCGPEGYLQSFGAPICEAFLGKEYKYSTAGQI